MIRFSTVELWSFWDFTYLNGHNPIEEWFRNGLSEESQLAFWKVLKDCQKTESSINWVAFKRFLSGKYREFRIWELIFYSDRRQHRIFGIFGPERKQATLLMGCYHKGKVYNPPDAMETAYKRAGLLSRREVIYSERKIPVDR